MGMADNVMDGLHKGQQFEQTQQALERGAPLTLEDKQLLLKQGGIKEDMPLFKQAMGMSDNGFKSWIQMRKASASSGIPIGRNQIFSIIDANVKDQEQNKELKLAAVEALGNPRAMSAVVKLATLKRRGLLAPDPAIVEAIARKQLDIEIFTKRGPIREKYVSAVLEFKQKHPELGGFGFQKTKEQFTQKIAFAKKQGAVNSEDRWIQIDKETSPKTAPSIVRLAAMVNMRADRELAILNDPKATPQQIAGAVVGLASILKGGVPTEMEIEEQEYKTLKTDIATLRD